MADKFVPNFKVKYNESVAPELFKEFGYSSKMQVPVVEKIVLSVGVGEATTNKKLLDAAVKELEQISLRGDNMWYFLERLICIALPRVKDFKGVNPNAFDGHGNYSLGITEQIIFPEIDYDKIERVSGLNVAIVTSAKTDEEAFALLKKLGMPFAK